MNGLVSEVGARGQGQARTHALAVRSMFDRISPTYDLLNRLMSMGIDRQVWVLPHSRGLWTPATTRHTVQSIGDAEICGWSAKARAR